MVEQWILLLLLLLAPSTSSHKILVYNVRFAHSDSNYMGKIADILTEAGHKVDTLIPIINRNGHDGSVKAHAIYVEQETDMEEYVELFMNEDVNLFSLSWDDFYGNHYVYSKMGEMFAKKCNQTLHHPGLINRLTKEKYDLLITETFDFCGVGIHHIIKAKALITVGTSAVFDKVVEYMGVPMSPTYNPAWTSSSLDVHSMVDRAINLYRHWLWKNTFTALEISDQFFQQLYGPAFPQMTDLIAESAYYFVNTDPYTDFARPMLKKIVELGGIGVKDPQPLNENWQNVLALRPRTVLLSFGSVMLSYRIQIDYRRSILQALSKFPDVTFIWKYEKPGDNFTTEEVSKVKNVFIDPWVPQSDLLNDSRLVAFITHGGMGSTQETAARGVPGIFVPLFADQPRNAAMMAHTGMGIVFDKYDIGDSEKFEAAIRTILDDKRYSEKAKKISRMLAKRPFSPRETLIKYAEFAAEFGASENLRPQSIDMSTFELYNLDLLLFLIIIVLTFAYLVFFLVSKIVVSKQKLKSQ